MSICIKKLEHIYDEKSPFAVAAIKDVDLEIQDNEFVCIIGHTGSGKSTLVQHLNGILRLTSAEKAVVADIDLTVKKPDMKKLRKKVGMVFQYPEYQLFEQTVFEDIAFGPKNMGLNEEEIKAAVKGAMRLVGLDESLENVSPFELSGGQKRRCAIAGVLSMNPEILVLDEPIAGLDPKGKSEMLDLIKRYREEKHATVIMISHNMDDIARIADRVVVMCRGKKIMDGTPKEVFSHQDRLLEIGLGLPTASLVVRELNKTGKNIPTDICKNEELVDFIVGADK